MSDLESDDEGDIPATARREDEEVNDQVNGELQDEVEDMQTKHEGNDDDDEENGDDDDTAEDESELLDGLWNAPILSLNEV